MKNNRLVKYIVDSYQELKKVTWPTKKQLVNDTFIVIVSATVATVLLILIDLGLTDILQYFTSLKG